jgi:hemerythrin
VHNRPTQRSGSERKAGGMKKIAWDDSLAVGIDVIDSQHQTWIARYNSVVDAIGSAGATASVVSTLDFLLDYTSYHFTTEEGIMRSAGYPEFEGHQAKHGALRQAVANLGADFEEEGSTAALGEAVETLLGTWLIQHIKNTDQLFGAYVRDNGITVSTSQ